MILDPLSQATVDQQLVQWKTLDLPDGGDAADDGQPADEPEAADESEAASEGSE